MQQNTLTATVPFKVWKPVMHDAAINIVTRKQDTDLNLLKNI